MRQATALGSRRPKIGAATLATWVSGTLSVALLAYVVYGVARQMLNAPPPQRLLLVRDVPLPSGLGTSSFSGGDPLAPGVTQQFDGFDFQAYDPRTHKLFVAHTGPNPDELTLARIPFDPAFDGHVIVYDTVEQRVEARVNIPHVAGLALAPDVHKAFAADADDNIVYAIDENTLEATPIELQDNDSPDAVSYDPDDHLIIVSDPGAPANPDKTLNVDPNNQNVVLIDAREDKVVATINIGTMAKLPQQDAPTAKNSEAPTFGYDIGHNRYDEKRRLIFVTTQILPDADSHDPNILPPRGTGELMAIDPVKAEVVQRLALPNSCSTPHGMALDTQQEVAFIACVDVDAATGLLPNLVRVDLDQMKVILSDPKLNRLASVPDVVLVDSTYHVLFVACKGGISVFDEQPGAFRKLSDYIVGKGTHTIALDEQTQFLYLPQNAGGRPVLRVMKYNPNGA